MYNHSIVSIVCVYINYSNKSVQTPQNEFCNRIGNYIGMANDKCMFTAILVNFHIFRYRVSLNHIIGMLQRAPAVIFTVIEENTLRFINKPFIVEFTNLVLNLLGNVMCIRAYYFHFTVRHMTDITPDVRLAKLHCCFNNRPM